MRLFLFLFLLDGADKSPLTLRTGGSRSTPEGQEWRYGDLPLIQSSEMTGKKFSNIGELTAEKAGQELRLRVRVHASR